MKEISIDELREYMLEAVGDDDLFQVDLVNRYIDFTVEYRKVRDEAREVNRVTTTKNGSQEFEKESVAHKQMRDINKEMLAIQRLLELKPKEFEYDMGELTGGD